MPPKSTTNLRLIKIQTSSSPRNVNDSPPLYRNSVVQRMEKYSPVSRPVPPGAAKPLFFNGKKLSPASCLHLDGVVVVSSVNSMVVQKSCVVGLPFHHSLNQVDPWKRGDALAVRTGWLLVPRSTSTMPSTRPPSTSGPEHWVKSGLLLVLGPLLSPSKSTAKHSKICVF